MPKDNERSIMAITGILLVVFATAFLVPALFVALESPTETTLTQTVGNERTINGYLHGTVTSTDFTKGPAEDTANITVINKESGSSGITGPLAEDDTATVSLSTGDVNVTTVEVLSDTQVTITYEYPISIGWPASAKTVMDNAITILFGAVIILIVGLLFIIIEVFS